MKRRKKPKKQGVKSAFVFILLVFFLFLISFSFKVSTLIKQSKFDGENRFTIVFLPLLAKVGIPTVVSFDPKSNSISHVVILNANSESLGKFLAVPIDGVVSHKQPFSNATLDSMLFETLIGQKETVTSLTSIDVFRLLLFTKGVAKSSLRQVVVPKSMSEEQLDRLLVSHFTDQTLLRENVSIEIINATKSIGLGSRLARLLTNIGGNVVSVSTSDQEQAISTISYYGKKTFTLKKLSSILGFEAKEMKKQSIADIIIILGKDSLLNTF